MKINFWSMNYAPELTGIGVYNAKLCEYLAREGDTVSAVCGFAYYPQWKKLPEDGGRLYKRESLNGVTVQRCWQYVPKSPTVFRRIVHELSFALTSFLRQLTLPSPDVYVVVTPPMIVAFCACLLGVIRRVPVVVHIQDLQIDAVLRLKMMREGPLVRVLRGIEDFMLHHASLVSCISADMLEWLRCRRVAEDKRVLLPNSVDLASSPELPMLGSFRKAHSMEAGKRLISYAGNIGMKEGLDVVLHAARLLADDASIQFVIAGNGSYRAQLLQLKQHLELKNVLMLDVLPENEYLSLLVDSDICLVPQQPGAGASFLPSKLLRTLAMGKPVITNATSDSSLNRAVAQGGFGVCVAGADAEQLALAIRALSENEHQRAEMGEAGKRWVSQFDSRRVLPAFRARLEDLCGHQGRETARLPG